MTEKEQYPARCIDCSRRFERGDSYTIMSGGGYGDPPDIVCDECLRRSVRTGGRETEQ